MATRILVPLDGSSLAATALAHAISLTAMPDTQLTLLRVVERTTAQQSVDPLDWHLQRSEAQVYLEQMSERLQAQAQETLACPPEVVLLEGNAADRIVEYAQNAGMDFIVFTSHGRGGFSGWNMSSVASKIAVRAATSMLLVRPSLDAVAQYEGALQPARYRRIVVPLDGSQRAEHVLPMVSALAERHGAELILLHVVAKPELIQRMPLTDDEIALVDKVVMRNQRQASDYFAQLGSRLAVRTETAVLIEEDAAGALHQFINEKETDLVVLSAHGHTGRQQWAFGSLVTSFLTYGTTSLLIMQDMPLQPHPTALFERPAQTWKEEGLRATLTASAQGEPSYSYDRAAN
jgi:nucleotide-binding universal stress UspA family protein